MARGNLAAARGAAARLGKSPTSEVDVRPGFHPVGTATERSTLVRDLTRPLEDSLRSRPARAGARRSRASRAEATKRPKLNPRPPKSNRESCETHNANEPAYAPARARTRAIPSRIGPNVHGGAPAAGRDNVESAPL